MQWHKHGNLARLLMGLASIAALLTVSGPAVAEPPDRPGIENPSPTPEMVQSAALADHVDINNFDFAPMTLTVKVGTKVTWANHDDVPHTVVSADDPALFKSPPLDTDDAYSFTFAKAGTYKYFCSVHPQMVGIIVVK